MNKRLLWTLTEAAEHVEESRSTLRRRLNTGSFPGATQGPDGVWRVGVEDLLGAGCTLKKTWLTERAQPEPFERAQPGSIPADPNQTLLSTERAQLEIELAHERAHTIELQIRLDTEKQLRAAAERNANDLRTSLRILETTTPHTTASVDPPQKKAARRRWFRGF